MKKIALHGKYGNGKFALVSNEDYEYLSQFRWHISNTGYPQRGKRYGLRKDNKAKSIQMHRDVAIRSGVFNPETFHDHIDRNKLNNQRENIRPATRSENGFNRVTPLGVSGVRGVKPNGKRWQVAAGGNNTRIYIGTYDTIPEASMAYKAHLKAMGLIAPV